jgi:AraC family transcriptional regulator, regulatory protein of adaptative response / methylated-DNA-[protein]-cysteine methyltransferase
MTSTTIPANIDGETIRFATGPCSLGLVLAAASENGLCAILFGDERGQLVRDLQDRFPHACLAEGGEETRRILAQVVGFIEKPAQDLDLPLDPRGTPFQQRVWKALREVPAGITASYGEIAKRIGQPRDAKDVAEACAANAIAVAIPCHRIVRADGSISGYRWGVRRKRALLAREAA